jgi:alkanesulfonate monooxygenase SsuD/methylene tetrahydromethanopterin reductase-like flavin-dependent oxidoreductase (luciferase family)
LLRLGYKASAEQFGPSELLDYSILAEARGFRQLWSEGRVSFRGQYYRTDKATIYDRPTTMQPIYVAAAGPVIAKYAGQFADGDPQRALEDTAARGVWLSR